MWERRLRSQVFSFCCLFFWLTFVFFVAPRPPMKGRSGGGDDEDGAESRSPTAPPKGMIKSPKPSLRSKDSISASNTLKISPRAPREAPEVQERKSLNEVVWSPQPVPRKPLPREPSSNAVVKEGEGDAQDDPPSKDSLVSPSKPPDW